MSFEERWPFSSSLRKVLRIITNTEYIGSADPRDKALGILNVLKSTVMESSVLCLCCSQNTPGAPFTDMVEPQSQQR